MFIYLCLCIITRNRLVGLPVEFIDILETVENVNITDNPWTDLPVSWSASQSTSSSSGGGGGGGSSVSLKYSDNNNTTNSLTSATADPNQNQNIPM